MLLHIFLSGGPHLLLLSSSLLSLLWGRLLLTTPFYAPHRRSVTIYRNEEIYQNNPNPDPNPFWDLLHLLHTLHIGHFNSGRLTTSLIQLKPQATVATQSPM